MSRPILNAVYFLSIAQSVPAQGNEGVPTTHEMVLAPGQRLDLDTGIVLRVHKEPPYVADLRFDRDGAGFFLEGALGAQRGDAADERPASDEWSDGPLRIPDRRRIERPAVWFVRTDCGSVARVEVAIGSTYEMGGTIVRWALAPGKRPIFRSGPSDLRARFVEKGVELTWSGEAPQYRVVVEGKGGPRTLVAKGPRLTIDSLAPSEVYRARVHSISGDGVLSLASEVAFKGVRHKARSGVVVYPERWYDTAEGGGLSLLRGEAAATGCEVVFYLYGVYVRGGGVQKLGSGESTYVAATELPEGGYRPIYDRLDGRDVYALRLPDGRLAKVWLEPVKGDDLRDGMRVHYAFLEGGGSRFLTGPSGIRFAPAQGGLQLSWQPVAGAVRYHVKREGDAGEGSPVEASSFVVKGLEENRFHRFLLTAVDGFGEASMPSAVEAHTFGPGFRVGRFDLDTSGREGVELASDAKVAFARGAKLDPRLDLVITSSAGGCAGLTLTTPHGAMSTGGRPFGEFPTAAPDGGFTTDVSTDNRRPESEVLWVKTADGTLACVRISGRNCPKVTFEYVLRVAQ